MIHFFQTSLSVFNVLVKFGNKITYRFVFLYLILYINKYLSNILKNSAEFFHRHRIFYDSALEF